MVAAAETAAVSAHGRAGPRRDEIGNSFGGKFLEGWEGGGRAPRLKRLFARVFSGAVGGVVG